VLVAAFTLTVIALTYYSVRFGLDRQDRFEVAAITVHWLTLIINGILLSRLFRRRVAGENRPTVAPTTG
jgi:hypothetical protein